MHVRKHPEASATKVASKYFSVNILRKSIISKVRDTNPRYLQIGSVKENQFQERDRIRAFSIHAWIRAATV